MLMYILVFSFLKRHMGLVIKTLLDSVIPNLIMSNEIDKSTIIRIILCSIINFITKL